MLFHANFRAVLLSAHIVAFSLQTKAAENIDENSAGDLPGLELLEFLGQFETEQGEWMPPGELLMEEFETLLDSAINDESGPTTGAAGASNDN
jgi:hypothetical protein